MERFTPDALWTGGRTHLLVELLSDECAGRSRRWPRKIDALLGVGRGGNSTGFSALTSTAGLPRAGLRESRRESGRGDW